MILLLPLPTGFTATLRKLQKDRSTKVRPLSVTCLYVTKYLTSMYRPMPVSRALQKVHLASE